MFSRIRKWYPKWYQKMISWKWYQEKNDILKLYQEKNDILKLYQEKNDIIQMISRKKW